MPPKNISAALGISAHSGWGVVVAVSGKPGAVEILQRRRLQIVEANTPGVKQPYHHAAEMDLPDAKAHLEKCAAQSARLGYDGLAEMVEQLRLGAAKVVAAAVLLSSARELPDLAGILAAHTMIHTAEGIFFRQCFRQACGRLKIPVTGIREKELEAVAKQSFRSRTANLQKEIDAMKKRIGAPWTRDEKMATLAAMIALAG